MNKSSIEYQLSFSEPHAHYVEVSLFINGFQLGNIDLKMPVWTPGSYLIREFSKNVEQVQATDVNGNPLKVFKTKKKYLESRSK